MKITRVNFSTPQWVKDKMVAYRAKHRVNWSKVLTSAVLDFIGHREDVSWISKNIRRKVRR